MTTKTKKGFTIIEVVLVLAIAGLIFLMVFIALPALQRSQRNTQRENDISRFATAVNSFRTNNGGKLPFGTSAAHADATAINTFRNRYIDSSCATACGSEFTDPDGTVYSFQVHYLTTTTTSYTVPAGTQPDHAVHAVVNGRCGDEGVAKLSTGERQFALLYRMEGGSIYCVDNE